MAKRAETQDVVPVGSRVSWGAVLAGALVALALSVTLGVLGVAFGLTFHDDVSDGSLAIGAVIWAILSMMVSLFMGGFVASRATTGETKGEALIYGVLVWGLLFLILPVTVGLGASFGFGSLLGHTQQTLGQPAALPSGPMTGGVGAMGNVEGEASELQRDVQAEIRQVDPAKVAWWVFAGICLSILAAILGAIFGAGPEMVFAAIYRRTTVVTQRET